MMLLSAIGAMTIATLGQSQANFVYAKDQVRTPGVIEIRAEMFQEHAVRRSQVRYSDRTRGQVVGQVDSNGSVQWENSDRERLGGQDGPQLIYVQIFDGIFAIDPFVPLPAANEAAARMLFRGTSLQTDRAQHGRQYIERTEELFRKLEQARHDWLRDNGYYGVKVYTNDRRSNEEHANARSMPEPSAVFERPADLPRGKSREQVRHDEAQSGMQSVAAMMKSGADDIRISLPHHMPQDVVARVEKRNEENKKAQGTSEESVKIASD